MHISLAHGDGGELTHKLVQELILKYLRHEALLNLGDAAVLPPASGRIALTTDSFVVKPPFFPGGNIGSLAVNGTINDLAVSGARPLYLTLSLILEEGLALNTLEEVIKAVASSSEKAGVPVVAGDIKVVERGHGDGIYINTTGLGLALEGLKLGYEHIRPGDVVIVSGTVGDHGLAVLAARENFGLVGLQSDCAALHKVILPLLEHFPGQVKLMRDPTRGGLATALKEIAVSAKLDIYLEEEAIPLRPEVRGGGEMLGLDPLYLANEGKFCAVVSPGIAHEILRFLHGHPLGKEAAVIGKVAEGKGRVFLRTPLGATRELFLLSGLQLPRIC